MSIGARSGPKPLPPRIGLARFVLKVEHDHTKRFLKRTKASMSYHRAGWFCATIIFNYFSPILHANNVQQVKFGQYPQEEELSLF